MTRPPSRQFWISKIKKKQLERKKQGRKVGLKINKEKIKILTNGPKNSIYIDEHEIEYIDDFVYMGQHRAVSRPKF